ncbi:MAG: hypothetical protein IPJ65_02825 [Archangiaceae bacterium]|nr:hypothetical protein [Archangiaceae bacterium]
MSGLGLVLLLAAAPGSELITGRFRALTFEPGERRELRAAGLERVTGSSGDCLEEGMAPDAFETLYIEAKCGGVRTSIAWLANQKRIHVLVCAEEVGRSATAVTLRKKAQRLVKGWKSVTACVRGEEVQLLGWARDEAEKVKVAGVARKLGLVDKVEVLGSGERE